MTDGGKGYDKGKFTTNTSNSLFYLSSIKRWGLAGKCDSRKQDNFSKATFFVIAGFSYLKMSLLFWVSNSKNCHFSKLPPTNERLYGTKVRVYMKETQKFCCSPSDSTQVSLYISLTSLSRDAICVSTCARNFCAQYSGREIHCSKYF